MRTVFQIAFLTAVAALPAAAQEAPRKFPLGSAFKVVSISGFDVQKAGMTFIVNGEAQSNRLVGNGSAGCNTWNASVMLRDEQIEFTDIATTRKMCPKPRMTSEEAFLTTLRSAQRWRIDDKNRLIIEGEAARLLLTGGASAKPTGQKPDNKAAKPAAAAGNR